MHWKGGNIFSLSIFKLWRDKLVYGRPLQPRQCMGNTETIYQATVYSEVATDVHNTLQMHRLSIKKMAMHYKAGNYDY